MIFVLIFYNLPYKNILSHDQYTCVQHSASVTEIFDYVSLICVALEIDGIFSLAVLRQ